MAIAAPVPAMDFAIPPGCGVSRPEKRLEAPEPIYIPALSASFGGVPPRRDSAKAMTPETAPTAEITAILAFHPHRDFRRRLAMVVTLQGRWVLP